MAAVTICSDFDLRMLEFGKYNEKLEQGKISQESWGKRGFSFKKGGRCGLIDKMVSDENVLFVNYNWHLPLALAIYLYKNLVRSDQISRSVMSDSLRPHESQHARPPCPSPTHGVHSDSRPSSQ